MKSETTEQNGQNSLVARARTSSKTFVSLSCAEVVTDVFGTCEWNGGVDSSPQVLVDDSGVAELTVAAIRRSFLFIKLSTPWDLN